MKRGNYPYADPLRAGFKNATNKKLIKKGGSIIGAKGGMIRKGNKRLLKTARGTKLGGKICIDCGHRIGSNIMCPTCAMM